MKRKIWEKHDVDFLKKNISSMSINDLAKHFNVSYNSIIHKINKCGIYKKSISGEFWTINQDNILKEHFEYAPKDFIMNLLPNKTWSSIYQRGRKTLKLNRKTQDIIYLNYNAFSEWNEQTAYIFGFILADGYIKCGNTNSLEIELAIQDIDILIKMKEFLSFKGKVVISKRNTARLQIRNKKIILDLIDKGMPKVNKTTTAAFPKAMNSDMYRHFIRGVFDGDGSIYIETKTNRVCFQLLGTKKLLEEIKSVIPLNLSSICIQNRGSSGANIYCLSVKSKKSQDIFKWIYDKSTIYLDRKYNKFLNIKNKNSPYEQKCS